MIELSDETLSGQRRRLACLGMTALMSGRFKTNLNCLPCAFYEAFPRATGSYTCGTFLRWSGSEKVDGCMHSACPDYCKQTIAAEYTMRRDRSPTLDSLTGSSERGVPTFRASYRRAGLHMTLPHAPKGTAIENLRDGVSG